MTSRSIIDLCQQSYPKYYNDCSGFVKAVANNCGILLSGSANEIIDLIECNWTPISDGASARHYARNGWFVIAGKKETDHGHLVLVVDGPLERRGKYPYAFWGRYHATNFSGKIINTGVFSRGHGNLNYAFGRDKRDQLIYRAQRVNTLFLPPLQNDQGYILFNQ